jgi:thiamine pyrophosphokinase
MPGNGRPTGVAIVVAGGPAEPAPAAGEPPGPTAGVVARVLADAGPDAWVVAADSGLDRAWAMGLDVDLVVGDLDSVTPEALDAATRAGVAADRHPEAKDATDLDLAIDAALARRPGRLVVVGSAGGRLDHLLAIVGVLAAPRLFGVRVEACLGAARLVVVRPGPWAALPGEPGDLLSLLPAGGPALGVTTRGLLYPLAEEDLHAGTTRGVSNEVSVAPASVCLREGVLVAVLPGERGTHLDRGVRPERIPRATDE